MSLGVTAPLVGLATAGVKYNAEMEKYSANLTTLLEGNSKEADKLLGSLKKMANTTPFETTDLVKATQTMMGFGIEVNKSQKYLKVLGDISMGDANKLESLTLAFSQVQSTGRLTGQDLLQMVNQGFNPLKAISDQTGESMAELKERMSKGGISADEVANAMERATQKGGLFYKSMDKAGETTEGKLSTLKDEFNTALGELTASLLPFMMKVVEGLTKVFQWFSNLDEGQKKIILTIGGVLAVAGPLLMIIGKIMTAIKLIMPVIALLTSPIGLVVTAIGAVIGVLVYCYKKFEWFRDGVNAIAKGIVNIFIWMANSVIRKLNNMIKFFLLPFNAVIEGLNQIPGVKLKKLKLEIPKIPKLATGTNYIAQEGLAYLHEGEAVVPKKYNPAVNQQNFQYNNNNDETNALLVDLNKNVIDLQRRQTVLEINGKQLAQATYQNFEQEGNRLGKSSVVVRR